MLQQLLCGSDVLLPVGLFLKLHINARLQYAKGIKFPYSVPAPLSSHSHLGLPCQEIAAVVSLLCRAGQKIFPSSEEMEQLAVTRSLES